MQLQNYFTFLKTVISYWHNDATIIYIYIDIVRIVGTLGKYDQRRLWKLICIVRCIVGGGGGGKIYLKYIPIHIHKFEYS